MHLVQVVSSQAPSSEHMEGHELLDEAPFNVATAFLIWILDSDHRLPILGIDGGCPLSQIQIPAGDPRISLFFFFLFFPKPA